MGYMSISDARDADVRYAKFYNKYGVLVEANISSIQVSMDYLAQNQRQPELVVDLAQFSAPESYPISSFTYLIFRYLYNKQDSKLLQVMYLLSL